MSILILTFEISILFCPLFFVCAPYVILIAEIILLLINLTCLLDCNQHRSLTEHGISMNKISTVILGKNQDFNVY